MVYRQKSSEGTATQAVAVTGNETDHWIEASAETWTEVGAEIEAEQKLASEVEAEPR